MKKNIIGLIGGFLLSGLSSLQAETGITIGQAAAPQCNLALVTVTLENTDAQPPLTYNGPAFATITLPAGLSFVRVNTGETTQGTTAMAVGQTVDWTIPENTTADTKTLKFYVSASKPGSYTVTAEAMDDQGEVHSLTSNTQTLTFAQLKNGTFSVEKNETLVAQLASLIDSTQTTPATSYLIQPTATYGTVEPTTLLESPYAFTYIPNPDFKGNDIFTVQARTAQGCVGISSVFISVGAPTGPLAGYADFLRKIYNALPANKAPIARAINLGTVDANMIKTVDLRDYVDLSNGTSPFVYTIASMPQVGTASVVNDTVLMYTTGNTATATTFSYKVTDANGASSTATVTVNSTGNPA